MATVIGTRYRAWRKRHRWIKNTEWEFQRLSNGDIVCPKCGTLACPFCIDYRPMI